MLRQRAGRVLIGLPLTWLFGADHRRMRRILRGPQVIAQVVGVVEHGTQDGPAYGGFAPMLRFRSVGSAGHGEWPLRIHRKPSPGACGRYRYAGPLRPSRPPPDLHPGLGRRARGLWVFLVRPLMVFFGVAMVVSAFV